MRALNGILMSWIPPIGLSLLMTLAMARPAAVAEGLGGSSPSSANNQYAPYPVPDKGHVTDIAGVLSLEDRQQLENRLAGVENRTGVQIAVVVLSSIQDYPGTPNSSIETFATGIFDKYRIGNLPKNDGVLLLVAVRDHKARIELGKYYGHTRDAKAQQVMDRVILPRFKKADLPGGIMAGANALCAEFAGIRFLAWWVLPSLAVGGLSALLVGISLVRSGKRGWGWVIAGVGLILLLAVVALVVSFLRRPARSAVGGSGGGGGGGSFGGGSSGGGGASGSW